MADIVHISHASRDLPKFGKDANDARAAMEESVPIQGCRIFLVCDAAVLFLIFSGLVVAFGQPLGVRAISFLGFFLSLAPLSAYAMGFYRRNPIGGARAMARLLVAWFFCATAVMAAGVVGLVSRDTQIVAIIGLVAASGGMALVRFLRCEFARTTQDALELLVVAPASTVEYFRRLSHIAGSRMRVADAVTFGHGDRCLNAADRERVVAYAREHRDATIVIAGGLQLDEKLTGALVRLKRYGVQVTTASELLESRFGQLPIKDPDTLRAMTTSGIAKTALLNRLGKRAIDLTVAMTLLVLLWPAMSVIAFLVRRDGGGALYHQVRIGFCGQPFTLLKFRSMRADAELDGVARWAASGDDRVTKVGRVLRRYRLDELPQLINVLRGDMSLVGPRPERPDIVEWLKTEIPTYDCRHLALPGLTGWAQINYSYGACVEDAIWKTRYDLYYVKHSSPLFDLCVLLQTIRVVIFAEGSR